ncbi:MAG TPA: MMPL family transporter, partial [Thermoanaerobaculia bacterium]
VLVVAVLLLVCLRTPGGLVLAMGKTLVVLVGTGGVMAMAGVPITLVTTILPVLLLALCVTDEVHVVARLEAHLAAAGGEPDGGEGGETEPALLATLGELTRPIVTTSVSTAIGFLSFLGASIGPMRQFGVFAAVGILLAMVATFTLTPALAVTLPRSWWVTRGGGRLGRRPSHRAPTAAAGRRRRAVGLAAGLLLLAAGAPGLLRLRVQDSWIDNFDPTSPLVRAERELNARFWGTYRFDVVLTGGPGFFHRPDGAALVAAAARAVAGAPEVGGVVTHLEPLDRVAELLGLPVGAAALPADALRAVVEVAAAYPGQLGLERMITADGHAARLTAMVDSADYRRARALAERLEREMAPLAEAAGVAVHASGDLPVATATVAAVVGDQLRSIGWTLAGVAVLLFAAGRRIWTTLVQLVPPAAAAWLILAAMGWAGKPLGVATSLFAALTIGIGVDLALHVTSAYEDRRARGLAAADAVGAAFAATAAGRRWSTLVLSGGFLVLTVSSFAPNRDLGILLAAAMPAAYLTTGLFVPRMLAR